MAFSWPRIQKINDMNLISVVQAGRINIDGWHWLNLYALSFLMEGSRRALTPSLKLSRIKLQKPRRLDSARSVAKNWQEPVCVIWHIPAQWNRKDFSTPTAGS